MKTRRLPGGPLRRVSAIDEEGNLHNPYGDGIIVTEKDREFADKFWSGKGRMASDLKGDMMETVRIDGERGTLSLYVGPSGIDPQDKKRLSAYRVLAQEIGYEVGEFDFHLGADTATATIRDGLN